jgi:hypothetical protein
MSTGENAKRWRRPTARWGVLSFFLCFVFVLTTQAELNPTTYRQANWEACKAELEAGSCRAELLLVQAMQTRDAAATLNFMRLIYSLPDAPKWVRQEALQILCEAFCSAELTDSLRVRSKQLLRLSGAPFHCPLLLEPSPPWAIQIGAFSSKQNAERALKPFTESKLARRVQRRGSLHIALLGRFESKKSAKSQAKHLKSMGEIADYRLIEVAP